MLSTAVPRSRSPSRLRGSRVRVSSRPTAVQMMPYASLNAMAKGLSFVACSTSGKSSSWRPPNVPITNSWPANNVKASGAPICMPSSSVLRRDRFGFVEPARHRRRERVDQPDRPAQSSVPRWRAPLRRSLREAAGGRHVIGGFDRDVEGREMRAEHESRVAGCFGNRDRLRRDAGPDGRRPPAPTAPRARRARCVRAASDRDARRPARAPRAPTRPGASASGVQTRLCANSASRRA